LNQNKFHGTKSSEAIKNIYLESIDAVGGNEVVLGANTSEIMIRDPKLLGFVMARYKFVSKMFNTYESVLEIGCQEGFGTLVVASNVRKIHGVDFYKPYIDSCNSRLAQYNLNISFDYHDMLDGPVDSEFEGVFALDVLEHIEKSDEDLFMMNILSSLGSYGSLIIGMPSIESQPYASEASKIGHVNCKSGNELSEFCQKYFHNVFLFSMNDEVLHTGFLPMSHYLFALCTSRK